MVAVALRRPPLYLRCSIFFRIYFRVTFLGANFQVNKLLFWKPALDPVNCNILDKLYSTDSRSSLPFFLFAFVDFLIISFIVFSSKEIGLFSKISITCR